jgi:hypothetical protein
MNSFKLLALINLLIINYSCVQKVRFETVNDNLIKNEYYKNGELKQKTIFIEGNRDSYINMNYNDDNVLTDSFKIVNGVKEGVYKKLLDRDSSIVYTTYRKGKKDGIQISYFSNGELRYEGEYVDDKQFGEWKFYYVNGMLKSFEYFARLGDRTFLRHYNQEGQITKSMGDPIIKIRCEPDTVIPVDSSIHVVVFFLRPPNTQIRVKLFQSSSTEKLIEKYDFGSIEYNHIKYEKAFSDTGKTKLIHEWIILDTINGFKQKDRTVFFVRVTPH